MSAGRISSWTSFFCIALCLSILPPSSHAAAKAGSSQDAPVGLQTDNLINPLGLDNPTPQFAWQLSDTRRGAHQTAYRIQVATTLELLASGKPDAWDSGRIESNQSIGIPYAGSAVKPSTRYYWQVEAWDQTGHAYSLSQPAWWETGLLDSETWRSNAQAKWIGYQNWEEAAVRSARGQWITTSDGAELAAAKATAQRIDYLLPLTLDKPAKKAILFVTGQDVASAWINGKQVATGAPLPPWKQLPWKKYVQIDVTGSLHPGANTLAIEITHYVENPNGMAGNDTPPMSATLVAQLEDGSTVSFASNTSSNWKASVHPADGWMNSASEDASWKPVIAYAPDPNAEPLSNPWPAQTVKALRNEFAVQKPVASARLYATALGAYEIFLNGNRAGDDVLAPGWTDFRLSLKYQTYDVTAQLTQGNNTIAALIAPGWYSTPLEWFQQPNLYGHTPPSLNARLRIQYTDGSIDWIVTDSSWKASQSSILKAEIYDGETEDARLDQAGWDTAGFNDGDWSPVEIRQPELAGIHIDAQDFQPIRVERTLPAKVITEPKPGVYIVDFGQEFSGVERLHLDGPEGAVVQVRTGEVLNADGTLYTENLRTALSTDHFILAGQGSEEFQPKFTFHGFRYIELTGLKTKPSLDRIQGVVFHTSAPFTAELKTGSAMLNQLWSNILWGQRSN
ncbi:MAG TPA: family 78 glycoside hydrolase catalytic domain, partial [Acidobacteriaceae bacterium]|nr:family 78 glycoside hydrolase catalytic domain [Acidobacteriaceae bacterium]